MLLRFNPVVVLFTLFISFCASASNSALPLDRVVAIVNDQVITQNQLDIIIKDTSKMLQATDQPLPSSEKLKAEAMEQLIKNTLQLQLAKRNNIVVSDKQLNDTIAKIAEKNHLTVAQLKESLANQGMNFTRFRAQLQEQMTIHELQQQVVAGKIKITPDEVKAIIHAASTQNNPNVQYRVDDLLISLNDTATSEAVTQAQKQAEQLLQKAKQGMSLSEIANSTQPALQYADLGWRHASELPSLFAEQVIHMKPGTVKGPFKAPNGIHLIKLIEVQGLRPLTETEAKNVLYQQKITKEIDTWLAQIRKSAYVKIM